MRKVFFATCLLMSCGPSQGDIINELKANEETRFKASQALLDRMEAFKRATPPDVKTTSDPERERMQAKLDSLNEKHKRVSDSLNAELDKLK